jgi:hypothetical protein
MAMAMHRPLSQILGILVTLVCAGNRCKELHGEANHQAVTSVWPGQWKYSSTAAHPTKAIAQNIPPELVAFASEKV